MMKYSIYVLIAVSVLASGHARPPLYKKHLMRPNASEYPHGDDEKFDAIMKDVEFPRIASILDHGSRAIVFHGMFGAGKSSVIERLSQIPDLVISSGQNVGNHAQQQDQKGKKAIGHTTLTKPYLMHVPHRNKFLLIDTPGFGEKNDAIRKDVLDESVKVVKILKDNQIPLAGIYFVIDPTPRDTVVKITSNLELIKLCYGEDAAKKTRIVLNKSDQLARTGKVYIEGALQTTLQKDFKSVFGVNCEKIIFICSDIYSEDCCLGQLVDDICEDPQRVLDIKDGLADFMNRMPEVDREINDMKGRIPDLDSKLEVLEEDLKVAEIEHGAVKARLRDCNLPDLKTAQKALTAKTVCLNQAENELREIGHFQDLSGTYADWNTDAIMHHVIGFLEELNQRNLFDQIFDGGPGHVKEFTVEFEKNYKRMHGHLPSNCRFGPRETAEFAPPNRFNFGSAAEYWKKLADHYQRHSAKKKEIDGIQSDVTQLTSKVEEHQNRVNLTKSSIVSAEESVETYRTKVDNVKNERADTELKLTQLETRKKNVLDLVA